MAINSFYPGFNMFQQPQGGNFVSVRTIEEAYNWPVAPGNSITFKVENTPYVCTKTKGFSPLDQPVFERYRLVKEEAHQRAPEAPVEAFDARGEINALWNEVKALKAALKGGNDEPTDAVSTAKLYEKSGADTQAHGLASEH